MLESFRLLRVYTCGQHSEWVSRGKFEECLVNQCKTADISRRWTSERSSDLVCSKQWPSVCLGCKMRKYALLGCLNSSFIAYHPYHASTSTSLLLLSGFLFWKRLRERTICPVSSEWKPTNQTLLPQVRLSKESLAVAQRLLIKDPSSWPDRQVSKVLVKKSTVVLNSSVWVTKFPQEVQDNFVKTHCIWPHSSSTGAVFNIGKEEDEAFFWAQRMVKQDRGLSPWHSQQKLHFVCMSGS